MLKYRSIDQGNFIKTKRIKIQDGIIRVAWDEKHKQHSEQAVRNGRIFSIVNPQKYDDFPKFRTLVTDFNNLDEEEKLEILKDWNWHGFGENYDINGDDIQGYDLNAKVTKFELESYPIK